MITQDMIDFYEPNLMFAVPRLAIVFGLLHCPDGPLNVDRGSVDFPDLFLPFKNLLRKIKELLLTLAPHEVSDMWFPLAGALRVSFVPSRFLSRHL